MKTHKLLLSIIFITSSFYGSASSQDERIQEMVDSVTVGNITGLVEKICTWIPRTSDSPGCDTATKWAQSLFEDAGFDSVYMDKYDKSFAPNVIAVLKGTGNTDTAWAVSGHIDAVADTRGADDNASGTAVTIRAAQVLARNSYRHDLRFVIFTGEEEGLKGSIDYAAKCKNGTLRGIINFDMIGYSVTKPNDLDLTYNDNPDYDSEWMADAFIAASELYVPGFTTDKHDQTLTECSSDHKSFWKEGLIALSGMEEKSCCKINPFYHSSGDLIGQGLNDFDLTTNSAKVTVAALATLAVIEETTGITESPETARSQFLAKYNSTQHTIEVILPGYLPGRASISIVDPRGTLMQRILYQPKGQQKTFRVNAENLVNGMYYLTIATDTWVKANSMVLIK